jgi:lysozyme
MKYSQDGIHLTEQFEGCRLTAYRDQGGVLTIGYGYTGAVLPGQTCTQAQAEEWLHQDIVFAETEVNRLVKIPLTQAEFDALVDFTFNCGCGNFDHSTLLKLVNAGDMTAAAEEFQKWDKCAGQVVAGLLRRRLAEAAEFKTQSQGA